MVHLILTKVTFYTHFSISIIIIINIIRHRSLRTFYVMCLESRGWVTCMQANRLFCAVPLCCVHRRRPSHSDRLFHCLCIMYYICVYFVYYYYLYVCVCVLFAAKPYFSRIEDHISEETNTYVDGLALPSMGSPARSSPHSQGSEVTERFSRKVFVGGLPPDIDEGKVFR